MPLKFGGNEQLSIGGNMVANGDFATDPDTSWGTWPSAWSIVANKARHAAGVGAVDPLYQDVGAVAGIPYSVTIVTSNRTAGSVRPSIGGTLGTSRTGNDTYTETIIATNDDPLKLIPSADFDGDIDDVSVVCLSLGFAADKLLPTSGDFAGKRCEEVTFQCLTDTCYMTLDGSQPTSAIGAEPGATDWFTLRGYQDIQNIRFAKKTNPASIRAFFRYLV